MQSRPFANSATSVSQLPCSESGVETPCGQCGLATQAYGPNTANNWPASRGLWHCQPRLGQHERTGPRRTLHERPVPARARGEGPAGILVLVARLQALGMPKRCVSRASGPTSAPSRGAPPGRTGTQVEQVNGVALACDFRPLFVCKRCQGVNCVRAGDGAARA